MNKTKYKHIYGPLYSWRLGVSLGVDLISGIEGKVCSFDCIYCQIRKTSKVSTRRKVFVPTAAIVKEIKSMPSLRVDYITFAGMGEPALAKNLGEVIRAVKKLRKEKTVVLTNASLLYRKDVRDDLSEADFVIAKLDASSQCLFSVMNRPAKGLRFDKTLRAIKAFRNKYKGKFALQVMFTPENKNAALEIARIAGEIKPDEVQLNTPLRLCPIKPLSFREMGKIKKCFKGLNIISVYDKKKKQIRAFNEKETLKRRGRQEK
ncbi:MAG: radical SAM protein [Candidatus Omnitrophota bacterium]